MANKERLLSAWKLETVLAKKYRSGMIHYDDLMATIADVPTVDTVEVVHGRWIISSDGYYPYCSECKEEPESGKMTNYCPSCGAAMDGGGKCERL